MSFKDKFKSMIGLDEDEYEQHALEMGYSEKLDRVIHKEMDKLLRDIRLQNSPFDHIEIKVLYQKYLSYINMEEEA